ncbi:alpha/beta hydrolase domain-containing protein [uncultured Sphingomonas sp.]|uniref:alpha/beta hydrolase domain-containing protein n=1 Tax=uncultured Sphingomonas sp. TaxID=158754 RepID=UPI0025F8F75E|nr:alpha/beta hydrolase domain-containing protein [uncultured Sphingomonas sp.]
MRLACATALTLAIVPTLAEGRLTRIIVEQRVPAGEGFTLLRGRYEGELDPRDPHNRIITDLSAAPRTPRGTVAYGATFAIVRPNDAARVSGVLFYDVPNRGNARIGADTAGHIRVVSGWQGDIPPGPGVQTASVPVAAGLTGPVLQRFVGVAAGVRSVPILGGIVRPVARPLPVSLDTRTARLWTHAADAARLVPVPAGRWAFADCRTRPFPGRPDPRHLCVKDGFVSDLAYTLVYRGRDPQVLGIGFAAVRDLVAFLRHGSRDDHGTPNPVAGLVRWPIITGTSQSGNFVKSFLHLGFNADEAGRRVFDGANPDIAARQVPLNIRFAVPGGAADLFELGSEGTLWWSRYHDRVRGRGTSSLLDRCRASDTCPKIIETIGSAELWGLRLSAGLVGTDARRDLPLPANVRRYYFGSVTHGGSTRGGFPVTGEVAGPGYPPCALALNPVRTEDARRALLGRLVDWVRDDRMPPDSRYPTLAAGTLVRPDAAAMGWPALPGVPRPEAALNRMPDYDVGPQFRYADESGVVSHQPPRIRRYLPARVPRVDADGNEVGGVPLVQLAVPIGTYTGWNIRTSGYGRGGSCGFIGGFVPFARTEAERRARGDPRPSLTARYRDHAGFVAQVRAAAGQQVRDGWLLPEDAERTIAEAEASDVLR